MPANVVEDWKRRESIVLEGYSSCSQIQSVAIRFAHVQEPTNYENVLLKIFLENETGKHYFSLDSEYTLYPDEKEVLLQAGLETKVINFSEENGMKVFTLYTSEQIMRRRNLL